MVEETIFNKIPDYIRHYCINNKKVKIIDTLSVIYHENNCDYYCKIIFKNNRTHNYTGKIYYNDVIKHLRKEKLEKIKNKSIFFNKLLNILKINKNGQ